MIFSRTNIAFELHNNLINDVRLAILGKEKILANLKSEWSQSVVPSLFFRNKNLVLIIENYPNTNINVSCPVQFCSISRYSFIHIVRDCLSKNKLFLIVGVLQASLF